MDKENFIKITPKDVFTHLLGFAALYVSIVSLITLLFQYINALFPDPLNFYYQGILNQIRWSTSALLVVFSVYLVISWLLEKDFRKEPAKRKLKFRGWLFYLTLFIAAITIIVDLITLIYNFYSGELTVKFALKVLTVMVVAVGVFGYYFWDLKREAKEKSKKLKMIAWLVSFVVIISVVAGFFIVGSPAAQRQVRFDEQRRSDLQILQGQIVNYWIQKERLPASLDDLKDSISGFSPPKDPESFADYEYNIITPLSFELCAAFKTVSRDSSKAQLRAVGPVSYPDSLGPYGENWSHDQGRVCFSRTIDPELYKQPEKAERLNYGGSTSIVVNLYEDCPCRDAVMRLGLTFLLGMVG